MYLAQQQQEFIDDQSPEMPPRHRFPIPCHHDRPAELLEIADKWHVGLRSGLARTLVRRMYEGAGHKIGEGKYRIFIPIHVGVEFLDESFSTFAADIMVG